MSDELDALRADLAAAEQRATDAVVLEMQANEEIKDLERERDTARESRKRLVVLVHALLSATDHHYEMYCKLQDDFESFKIVSDRKQLEEYCRGVADTEEQCDAMRAVVDAARQSRKRLVGAVRGLRKQYDDLWQEYIEM